MQPDRRRTGTAVEHEGDRALGHVGAVEGVGRDRQLGAGLPALEDVLLDAPPRAARRGRCGRCRRSRPGGLQGVVGDDEVVDAAPCFRRAWSRPFCVVCHSSLLHVARRSGHPGTHKHVAGLAVGVPGQDEQQVGEPVEVGDRQLVHRRPVLVVRRPCGALGPAYDGAGDVELGGAGRAAVEDERPQRRQVLVVVVAPGLEAVDVLLLDPQRRELGVLHDGRAEVGADVEQVVLHVYQDGADVLLQVVRQRDPELRVRLVHVGVGVQPRVVLGRDAHVAEPRLAAVTRACVDAGEVHHGGDSSGRIWLKNPSVPKSNRSGVPDVITGTEAARRHGGSSCRRPGARGTGGGG